MDKVKSSDGNYLTEWEVVMRGALTAAKDGTSRVKVYGYRSGYDNSWHYNWILIGNRGRR